MPENVEEKHLRDWVDDLSEVEVDTFIQEVYTQGWTTYWKTPLFEYDARPQHKRFLPLIDSGVQPLDVLIDQSHKKGIEFLEISNLLIINFLSNSRECRITYRYSYMLIVDMVRQTSR